MHVSSVISMVLTAALVLTGTWVYLWQMFGASNQLMAALSLLVVAVWLKSEKRNPTYALLPMIFMYVTTLAATAVTARNLYVTIAANPKMTGLPVAGAWAMIAVSVLLFVAAILIGWDGYKAYLPLPRDTWAAGPASAGRRGIGGPDRVRPARVRRGHARLRRSRALAAGDREGRREAGSCGSVRRTDSRFTASPARWASASSASA